MPRMQRRVDDEPLQRHLEHERRQQRVHIRGSRRRRSDRCAGAVLGRELEGAQRHRARLVGAEQHRQVGAAPVQHLGRAVPELGALDHRAVNPHVLHEHRQPELVGQAEQRPGAEAVQQVGVGELVRPARGPASRCERKASPIWPGSAGTASSSSYGLGRSRPAAPFGRQTASPPAAAGSRGRESRRRTRGRLPAPIGESAWRTSATVSAPRSAREAQRRERVLGAARVGGQEHDRLSVEPARAAPDQLVGRQHVADGAGQPVAQVLARVHAGPRSAAAHEVHLTRRPPARARAASSRTASACSGGTRRVGLQVGGGEELGALSAIDELLQMIHARPLGDLDGEAENAIMLAP